MEANQALQTGSSFDSGQALLIMIWLVIIAIFILILFLRRTSKNKYGEFYEKGGNIITDETILQKKIDEIKNGPLVQERYVPQKYPS